MNWRWRRSAVERRACWRNSRAELLMVCDPRRILAANGPGRKCILGRQMFFLLEGKFFQKIWGMTKVLLLGLGRWGANHLRNLHNLPVELYVAEIGEKQLEPARKLGMLAERLTTNY